MSLAARCQCGRAAREVCGSGLRAATALAEREYAGEAAARRRPHTNPAQRSFSLSLSRAGLDLEMAMANGLCLSLSLSLLSAALRAQNAERSRAQSESLSREQRAERCVCGAAAEKRGAALCSARGGKIASGRLVRARARLRLRTRRSRSRSVPQSAHKPLSMRARRLAMTHSLRARSRRDALLQSKRICAHNKLRRARISSSRAISKQSVRRSPLAFAPLLSASLSLSSPLLSALRSAPLRLRLLFCAPNLISADSCARKCAATRCASEREGHQLLLNSCAHSSGHE